MQDFEDLPEEQKLNNIRKDGAYIGKRKIEEFVIVLYQLNNFYIEIYYDNYRKYINRFNCFDSTELLDPYLDKMELNLFV